MAEFANLEPTFKDTYTLILKCMSQNQIYIMDEDSWWGRLCWLKLIALILFATSHTAGVVERIGQGADLVQMSTDLSGALVLWQAVMVYIQLYVNRKLIKNLILHLGSLSRTDDHLSSEMIAAKHEAMSSFFRWITQFYKVLNIYVYLYMLPHLMYVAFKHHVLKQSVVFSSLFYTKMPFRTDDNFLLYCLVYLIDFKILLDVANLVCFDILLMNATMIHLRLLFVVLQDDLRHIVQSGDEIEPTTAEMRLKKLIPIHQDLLKLMLELSNAFGAIFLIHLAFFSVTICSFGFAARIQPSAESIKTMIASNIILICIYTCCYCGKNLSDASKGIAEAVYDGYWHSLSHKYRRCILIIMMRSQKTQYIQSTSFTNISLETFSKILNATWSFLSLMTSMYEE